MDHCLKEVVEKLGDSKNGAGANDVLNALSIAVKLEHVAPEVLNLAFAQKSPKVQADSMNWLSQAIKDHGFGYV